jgi:hypothetical protein
MKKILLIAALAVCAAVGFQEQLPVIKTYTYGSSWGRKFDTIEVRKFLDSNNVCYVVANSYANTDGSAPQPTISCVKQ